MLSARTLRAATPTFSAAVKGKSGGVADVSAAAATAAKSGYWAGSEWVPASAKLSADWKAGKQTVRASTSGRGAGVGGAAMGSWVFQESVALTLLPLTPRLPPHPPPHSPRAPTHTSSCSMRCPRDQLLQVGAPLTPLLPGRPLLAVMLRAQWTVEQLLPTVP